MVFKLHGLCDLLSRSVKTCSVLTQGGGGIQERHMAYIFVFKDGLDPPSPPSPAI